MVFTRRQSARLRGLREESNGPDDSCDPVSARTPRRQIGIPVSKEEMEPDHHQTSVAKSRGEAPWLGFYNIGARTEPPPARRNAIADAQMTPTKSTQPRNPSMLASPDFQFTFKHRQSLELSPEARSIMAEVREEAAKIRMQGTLDFPIAPTHEPSEARSRKIAMPRSTKGRFSDVHKAQFQSMDSIANHPSAFRAAKSKTTRPPPSPADPSAPKSPPKTELDRPSFKSLKRPASRTELKPPAVKALKRTSSKAELDNYSWKFDTPSEESAVTTPRSPAKRLKPSHAEDSLIPRASSRPASSDSNQPSSTNVTPSRRPPTLHKTSSIPRLASKSSLMTPTKASMARSQTVKVAKTAHFNSPHLMSPSNRSARAVKAFGQFAMRKISGSTPSKKLSSPPTVGHNAQEAISPRALPAIPIISDAPATPIPVTPRSRVPSVTKLKSILRNPRRLYSDDPAKVAAGTHLATPPRRGGRPSFGVPMTEPVNKTKRVDFTASVLSMAERQEKRAREGLETVANGEKNSVTAAAAEADESEMYPSLPGMFPSNRPSTVDHFGASGTNMASEFTFRTDKSADFGSPGATTIRSVRSSDVGASARGVLLTYPTLPRDRNGSNKRKVGTLEEGDVAIEEDKENLGDVTVVAGAEDRPMKRARTASPMTSRKVSTLPLAKKAPVRSRLPTSAAKQAAAGRISRARLDMLATPKRR